MNCSHWHILKVSHKVFLVLGLTFVLYWWQKTRLFIAEPQQPNTMVVMKNSGAGKILSETNSTDINLLVQVITSMLEYPPRKVPEGKDIMKLDPQLFSKLSHQFLPNIKSPCWYEEFQSGSDVYNSNKFTALFPREVVSFFNKFETDFQTYLQNMDGKQYRLRCLPYFYIIGPRKCGTTDLFKRLRLHPQIQFSLIKEPNWWTLRGFSSDGFYHHGRLQEFRIPVKDFLDLFDSSARLIQKGIKESPSRNSTAFNITIGEGSTATIYFNHVWKTYKNISDEEPAVITADFIHAVQPDAKFISILRDPVERLYSDYLYFDETNKKTAQDFHLDVVKSLQLFQSCLSEMSLRGCTYSTTLFSNTPVKLQFGLYIVCLMDWLAVFKRENFLIICLEEYTVNLTMNMKNIFEFLNVDPFTQEMEEEMLNMEKANTRKTDDLSAGSMLPATRELLRQFYQPFNRKLASFLENDAFLWS